MTRKDYISMVDRAKRLSYEYYVLAQPTASDAQFDALVSEIEQAESEHPEWTLADSPTQQVGSDLSGNGKRLVRHRTPMLSCQKAQTIEAVEKWIIATEKKLKKMHSDSDGYFTVMWKYDGISCSLVYQDGVLVSAATRGDGKNGSDLLEHVKVMDTVPKTLKRSARNYDLTGRVEVRGEIVMPKVCLNQTSGYADCRSAASGICGKNYVTDDTRLLEFVPWAAIIDEHISEQTLLSTDNQVGMRSFLSDIGFMFVPVGDCYGFDGVKNYIAVATKERDNLPYPVDGLVVRVFTDNDFNNFGFTEHHPKGSIAYKFSAQKTVTRVLRIEVSVGATGKRTPVAYLEPVMIMGREVKQASLYSEKKMAELGVTEGCLVEVGLSNDVTPKVYRVVEDNSQFPDALAPGRDCSRGTKIQNSKLEETPAEIGLLPTEEPMPLPKPKAARPKKKEQQGNRSVPNNRYDVITERRDGSNRQAANDQPAAGQGGHRVLKVIGSAVVMSVALVIIWQTGLLIPLGLIGLATSGILK